MQPQRNNVGGSGTVTIRLKDLQAMVEALVERVMARTNPSVPRPSCDGGKRHTIE